jgi:ATP-dependent DNA helicase DinG
LGPLTEQLAELEATLAQAEDDELRGLGRRAAHLSRALGVVLDRAVAPSLVAEAPRTAEATPEFVRYTETTTSHRIAAARPVDVSLLLGALFAQQPTVFVSATMRMGDSFEHLKRRLGVPKARELFVQSPFDYPKQTCLYVAADLPDPDSPQFLGEAAARTLALVRASGGGAFVLCTSHRAVTALGEALRRAGLGHVLMQGEAPKASLVETFVAHGNAVLVATMGFWRGVDVPGRALRLVILDKLPFQSPYDPLVQARLAQLSAQELDPFLHYQLPQAALLLRQGFGRLVRSTHDRGMVAILDSRLKTRRYGALLIAALPSCPEVTTLVEAEARLRAFEGEGQNQAGSVEA